jgi:hypothetical protein
MNHKNTNSSTSKYSGKVLFATMMLIFVIVILVVFLGFSGRASAFSRYDKVEAQLAALSSLKAMIIKPKVGVMNGIVYNPPCSSAVVDETLVHEGDKIHNAVVMAIHRNSVVFTKDGVIWLQGVLDKPNAAWTAGVKDSNNPAK